MVVECEEVKFFGGILSAGEGPDPCTVHTLGGANTPVCRST